MIPIMKTVVSLRSPRISYQDKCLAKISQNQNLKNKISHFVRSTIIPSKEIKDSYKHIYFWAKILVILVEVIESGGAALGLGTNLFKETLPICLPDHY